ncbi:MAG: VOC family protein [Actinomycetota bacterium]|nr:VOC family protein [Actinomycetota bacterium]
MKLEFAYLPTRDLNASLKLYRDVLGFDELWREGEETVGLAVPGSDVALMLDAAGQPDWGPGPIFVVERLADFIAQHEGRLDIAVEPFEIPGGALFALRDPGGNLVYVMDQNTAEAAPAEDA